MDEKIKEYLNQFIYVEAYKVKKDGYIVNTKNKPKESTYEIYDKNGSLIISFVVTKEGVAELIYCKHGYVMGDDDVIE